jgi:hypothetical protein
VHKLSLVVVVVVVEIPICAHNPGVKNKKIVFILSSFELHFHDLFHVIIVSQSDKVKVKNFAAQFFLNLRKISILAVTDKYDFLKTLSSKHRPPFF